MNTGPWTHFATSSMAERIILRCHSQCCQVPLHLSICTHYIAQVLDTRWNGLSTFQSHFLMVCSGEQLSDFVPLDACDVFLIGQLLYLVHDSEWSVGGSVVQYRKLDPCVERHLELRLFGFTRHVLPSFHGQQTSRCQVRIYACDDRVRDHHSLHDGMHLTSYEELYLCIAIVQFAAFFLAFKGIDNLEHSDGTLTPSDLFTNSIFRNIVISLLATTGLYLIASLIFVSFWLYDTSMMYDWLLHSVWAMAYDYVFRAIHTPRSIIHQRVERVRCECLIYSFLKCNPD